MELLIWILLIAGIAGAVIPIVPGPILTSVALLLALISHQLNGIVFWFFVVSGILIFLIDFFMPAYLTKTSGASKRASNGALIGMVLSLFTGPGLFLGAFLGAFIGEFSITLDATKSVRASIYAVLGVFSGMAIKLLYTLTILGIYLIYLYL
tara:strand:- start:28 stop:483 length:456 start_codon:yes stop_codon:yes gene_type:complete